MHIYRGEKKIYNHLHIIDYDQIESQENREMKKKTASKKQFLKFTQQN